MKCKIVVTDGATLNPGDLSWDRLKTMGECEIYERSTYDENLQRCKDADVAVTNKVVFDKKTIDALPKLKCISVTATGYNIIDIAAAKERKIVVTNVPIYGTMSVAQMSFSLLLELAQHVGEHSKTVHEGKWCKSSNFCYWDYPLIELAGLTMGIIGCGKIGQATAKLAKAFDMKVIAYDAITPKLEDKEIKLVELDTLIKESDVISLHCPLTPQTDKFVNKDFISKMKKSAFLLNASRGQLVNEQDLADALNSGRIAGAGLDVLSCEPPKTDNPLLNAKNCIITPHIAWATHSARKRLLDTSVDNVKAFLEGRLQNVVS
jgi:glycerate dehydrogenase